MSNQYTPYDDPWHDEELLRKMYAEDMMSTVEIGDELGCDNSTVGRWLGKHGIERRENGKVPRKTLIDDLKRLSEELGRTPTMEALEEHSEHSQIPYKREFGTWNNALETAGLEPNNRYDITDDELLSDLRRLADQLGCTPLQTDVWKRGEFGVSTYKSRFGSWNGAIKEAGLEVTTHTTLSKEKLERELSRLADEHGEPITPSLVAEHGKYNRERYNTLFGSWSGALNECGYEPYTPPIGPNHPRWRGGIAVHQAVRASLGPVGWGTIAEENRADCCYMCEEEAKLLDVHHIIPVASGGVNGDWNLLTLCRSCHTTVEHYTRTITDYYLKDWSDDELPEGRLFAD